MLTEGLRYDLPCAVMPWVSYDALAMLYRDCMDDRYLLQDIGR